MTTKWTVTIDCADPALVARFWCTALGYTESDPPEGWDTWGDWLTAVLTALIYFAFRLFQRTSRKHTRTALLKDHTQEALRKHPRLA